LKPRIDSGVRCAGCNPPLNFMQHKTRAFSRDQYLEEHFQSCPAAQKLWESSRRAPQYAEIPQEALSGGQFDSYLDTGTENDD
jgi:hypothetical protein